MAWVWEVFYIRGAKDGTARSGPPAGIEPFNPPLLTAAIAAAFAVVGFRSDVDGTPGTVCRSEREDMRSTPPGQREKLERRRTLCALLLTALGGVLVADGVVTANAIPERPGPVHLAANDGLESVLRDWNPNLSGPTVSRIAAAVDRYSGHYGLEPELVAAVMVVESSVRPWAQSPKGAMGLMQVMPHMIHPLGLAGNPATIESNIEAGCWILSHNIRRWGEERGISAYFWGSNVRSLAYLEKVQEARETIRRQTS